MFTRKRQLDALELPDLRSQASDTLSTVQLAAVIIAVAAAVALVIYATREGS